MNYKSFIDRANEYIIYGWAVNPDDFNSKVSLDLIVNDIKVATCTAFEFREDLKAAGVSDGYSAFDFCPFYWLQEKENKVHLLYSDTGIVVPNSEMVLKSNISVSEPFSRDILKNGPKISILMPVFNVKTTWLKNAVESVISQIYENWELCVVDDASDKIEIKNILNRYVELDSRIKVKFLKTNSGISKTSNEAASMASGDYISLLDHDDVLFKNALYEVVHAINNTEPDVVYSDEMLMSSDGGNQSLHFKPNYSPDLLLSHNYITHFLTVKKTLFDQISGFAGSYDGAQDYDLILRLTEKTKKIFHISKVLYGWRRVPSSVSLDKETKQSAVNSGHDALHDALKRRGIAGSVKKMDPRGFYRIKRDLSTKPTLSIILTVNDGSEITEKCLRSILNRSTYKNYEIIVTCNHHDNNRQTEILERISTNDSRLRIIDNKLNLNYLDVKNHAASHASGEHIIFMHDDVEIISADWMETLLEQSQREDVGAVGGKLYYPDDTVQHAGIIVGIYGHAGMAHKRYSKGKDGHFNRLNCIQNISAVSGALLMVKKTLFDMFHGFDGEMYSTVLDDVDFCLRLLDKGYLNIFTPFCEAYHAEKCIYDVEAHEISKKFRKDRDNFQDRWKDFIIDGDPYYNPNLTVNREDFTYRNGLQQKE